MLAHLPISLGCLFLGASHSRPQRPRYFWSAPRIATSGQLQRHSDFDGFVNTIDWDQDQSDLSDLTLSMRRVTGSPWIADFRCWTWPEVAILGADEKERGLWGREWVLAKRIRVAPGNKIALHTRLQSHLFRRQKRSSKIPLLKGYSCLWDSSNEVLKS